MTEARRGWPLAHLPAGVLTALAITVAVAASAVRRVEVAGRSMAPALLPGDRLLVVRPFVLPCRSGAPWLRTGDVVALRDPRVPTRLLVKRVASLDHRAGTVWVLGDASEASTDSRAFGAVDHRAVVGRAVYRYAPGLRAGRGPWPPTTACSELGTQHG